MEPRHNPPRNTRHKTGRQPREPARLGDLSVGLRALREAMHAANRGDFSVRVAHSEGDSLDDSLLNEAASCFNGLMTQNEALMRELDRLARAVTVEGQITVRASSDPKGEAWSNAVQLVNTILENGNYPIFEAIRVLGAVDAGDLSQSMPVHLNGRPIRGEFSRLVQTVNSVVSRLRSVSSAVSLVVREVGVDGKLGAQAHVEELSGMWKELVDGVNLLATNLTNQVRNIAQVSTAIAKGDLSQKISVEAKGEILELKDTINSMVDQLRAFSAEVTRVAREVGTEGKLGGQAQVPGVAGTWKDLTDNVNFMAGNLTDQVRGIVKVVTAVANGDLSQKFVLEAKGEIAALADTINNMTDTLRTFAEQVTTVAREVGTEGILGGQAKVPGAAGTWRDLTDNVNMLAGNLTNQVRNIAAVTTAVAEGDLSQKITVDAKGEIQELKDTVNAMVEKLRIFAREVTRVAREVGTEGKLGGQAQVPGAGGTWQELTENVNLMAGNLTSQVRGIAKVVTAVANGDLSQRLVLEVRGEIAALADTINDMTLTLRTFAAQVTTVAREVGVEGKLGGQARVPGAAGTWKDLTDSVNTLAGNLTAQVRNIALVTTAVAKGDLSQKTTVEARGEILELKDTVNGMVEQLRTFAAEVTRVAREVGTEGQLGGQAMVPGVSGTWKDLTDNVNLMASNLTDQVRGIGQIVTAVANGELTKTLQLDAKGEIATLAETINNMTDTLRTFADQVTTVAREVGIDGKLGGQAKVPGAAGTWRDLTDNVNQLAANLTTQVRAISEVATSVIQGNLSRTISVGARGEVLGLKDTINQMITNLRDTTRSNNEQDWLKTNLARFFGIMQGQRDLQSLMSQIMSELTPVVGAQQGAFYLAENVEGRVMLKLTSSYAYQKRKSLANEFALGEGLIGQCALERKTIVVTDVPDDYVHISSGLGQSLPRAIAVLPVFFEDQVRGVIELASFHEFSPVQLTFLEQLMLNIGLSMNLIGTSMRTEELLQQLQGSNVELEKRRRELEEKALLLEVRNQEIAQASASLEAKAQELGRVSQYKSQFLTNMSHEIRTPLNSMMILAQMLAADEDKNLNEEQREHADTIHSAGRDLLALINQILDLSKVEAGRIETHIENYSLEDLAAFTERNFRPVALQRGLDFSIQIDKDVPREIATDKQLLDLTLKNLLANAFKFADKGSVTLRIHLSRRGLLSGAAAAERVAFAVSDTGIGIRRDQHEKVFEAFQQGDASITRKYGGTGLGLTISREYARVLGGDIELTSTPGVGSTFTLLLPISTVERVQPMLLSSERPTGGALSAPMDETSSRSLVPDETTGLAGTHILIVEDDARNLYAITSLLEKQGMTVNIASNAKEALVKLKTIPGIDLVLMDIMMPEIDGYQATKLIHDMQGFESLPIIALTAKASESDRSQCFEAGCKDYVVKPVENRQLLSIISRNLRSR